MREGRFLKSLGKREAVETDLHDSGIDSPESWREAIMDDEAEADRFFALLQVIEGRADSDVSESKVAPEEIEKFRAKTDSIERLRMIEGMNMRNAYTCVNFGLASDRATKFLQQRMQFYKDFIEGTITIKRKSSQWDPDKTRTGKNVKVVVEEDPIKFNSDDPDSIGRIKLGFKRDIARAVMLGTPELAIQRLAFKKSNEIGKDTTHLPQLRDLQTAESYRKILTEAKRFVAKKNQKELEPADLEHKAVLLAADWASEAMGYNDPGRTKGSSYTAPFEEAIAWARLGSDKVKRQLRGMRQKIEGVYLHNIKRFIGRSGENKYEQQRRRLYGRIKYLEANPDQEGTNSELETLRAEKKILDEKFARNASPAEKALFLHFELAAIAGNYIDWMNSAPLGLINWCYNALHHNVSKETVVGYARARNVFPDYPVTRDLIKLIVQLLPQETGNVPLLASVFEEFKIEISPEELCKVARYGQQELRDCLEKGYTKKTLIEHQWLRDPGLKEKGRFPFDQSKGQQQVWCVDNAFYAPSGWQHKRLGTLILNRLNAGIDDTLHDASYWLQTFEVPEEKNGTVYKDHASEMALLYSLTSVPEKFRSRIPTKQSKYSELFSEQSTEFIYESILPLVSHGNVAMNEIRSSVTVKLETYKVDPKQARSLKMPLPQFEEQLAKHLDELEMLIKYHEERKAVPALVGKLKTVSEARNKFIDEAQIWVAQHGSTPRDILVLAWGNRELALADGCADNPRAIKQWADLNALRAAYDDMERNGSLPENFTKADIMAYRNYLNELVRCYDGRTAIQTVAELKKRFNPEFEITPLKIDLGDGWIGEVLPKNDPRGMTIGYDTGCCMTLGGVSASCIKAGYEKPPYGFFALYREGRLAAQSFLYTNATAAPDTIICDNIEANEGRDLASVLTKYQDFFKKYLTTQLRRDKAGKFVKVQLGTGHSDVGLGGLNEAEHVPMPDYGIYTDAGRQKLMLALSGAEIINAKSISAELCPETSWASIKEQIMAIESQAFSGRGYSEHQLEAEFSNQDNVVIILKSGEKVIGYSTAIASHDRETLYVSSTAILPHYQGKGLVADLMYKLDIEAKRRGYKFYTRDARLENGYAAKLKKNYTVVEESEPFTTPYGQQQHLKMVIPEHDIPKSLREAPIAEHPEARLEFTGLETRQAAVIAELEAAIYPPGMRQGEEFFCDELEFEASEDHHNASLLLSERKDGREIPVGYAVAYITESEIGYPGSVLYISDTAILPEYQRKGYGRRLFEKIVDFANTHQSLPIEFHARSSTSYLAITNSEDVLADLGYEIAEDRLMEGYFTDEETGTTEDVHMIRLERTDAKEEELAA